MDHIYIITNGDKYCWVELTDKTHKRVEEAYLGICPTSKIFREWKFSKSEIVYQRVIKEFADRCDSDGMYFKCRNILTSFINREITALKK